MDSFEFKLKTHLHFGDFVSATLGERLHERGFRRVALVVDANAASQGPVQNLRASVEAACDEVAYEETAVTEPTYDDLEELRARFPRGLDAFVGVGGGSILDMAKALAALAVNPGPAISYRGWDLLEVPPLPVIAVPTTAGTGSEVTPNAVFIDSAERRKLGINGDSLRPVMAVLDAGITQECPRRVTLSSGIDAMVHAVEGFAAKGATPLSRVFSAEALKLVYSNLPRVLEAPNDLEARGSMLYGAYLAGAGLMNSGAGPAGALSYPLGVLWHVPHGLAGGAFVAGVARHNVDRGYAGYAPASRSLGFADLDTDDLAASTRFVARLEDWLVDIGTPTLSAHGVHEHDIATLVDETFGGLIGAIQQNPVPFDPQDAHLMMTKLLQNG